MLMASRRPWLRLIKYFIYFQVYLHSSLSSLLVRRSHVISMIITIRRFGNEAIDNIWSTNLAFFFTWVNEWISTQRSYIYKKPDTNSCLRNWEQFQICSVFFYTPCISCILLRFWLHFIAQIYLWYDRMRFTSSITLRLFYLYNNCDITFLTVFILKPWAN